MIFLIIIALAVVGVYYFEKSTGRKWVTGPIYKYLEKASGYCSANLAQGLYCQEEQILLGKSLAKYFTAISPREISVDGLGWQYIQFDITGAMDETTMEATKAAICMETRNYIQSAHGLLNVDLFVPVLTDTVLCVQIACSEKAHAEFRKLNFFVKKSVQGKLEEKL